jgi:hypothetical protein
MSILDDLPLATIVSIVAIVVTVIAYLNNDISFEDAMTALGVGVGGAGLLGIARAQSGKGTR